MKVSKFPLPNLVLVDLTSSSKEDGVKSFQIWIQKTGWGCYELWDVQFLPLKACLPHKSCFFEGSPASEQDAHDQWDERINMRTVSWPRVVSKNIKHIEKKTMQSDATCLSPMKSQGAVHSIIAIRNQ